MTDAKAPSLQAALRSPTREVERFTWIAASAAGLRCTAASICLPRAERDAIEKDCADCLRYVPAMSDERACIHTAWTNSFTLRPGSRSWPPRCCLSSKAKSLPVPASSSARPAPERPCAGAFELRSAASLLRSRKLHDRAYGRPLV